MSRIISFREALRECFDERMAENKKVLLIGEDIGLYGGAFGVTRGLIDKYQDQIIETPISENGFVGVGLGAAMGGYRPIVEIMFMDFVTLAMDQIVNHAAKINFMYAGQIQAPLVIRLPGGGGRGYGASHSQSLEAWFAHVPGLIVLAPSTPADAKGLMHSAIDEDNPVIFIENKLLYDVKGEVPDAPFREPIGKLRVVRPGDDVSIVSYGRMVQVAIEAAEGLKNVGLSAEVIDLRSLKPIDREGLTNSINKTGRVAIVSESAPHVGIAAEVAAIAAEECYDSLMAPVLRLSASDSPIPSATRLEKYIFPNSENIIEAIANSLFPS
jgi:pyruvate/2-oxoglutarate/acetoin dehydrogenase E1 component